MLIWRKFLLLVVAAVFAFSAALAAAQPLAGHASVVLGKPALPVTFNSIGAGVLDSQSGTSKQAMSRKHLVAADDIPWLQAIFQNFRVLSTGSLEIGNGCAATVQGFVEYPAGVYTDITWPTSSGPTTGDMTAVATAGAHTGLNGTTAAAGTGTVTSNRVYVRIPKGGDYWLRALITNTCGIYYWLADDDAAGDRLRLQNGTTWTLADLKNDAVFTENNPGVVSPLAVVGPSGKEGVLDIGDSIGAGQNDVANGTLKRADRRFGITAGSTPAGVAFVNASASSMQASASSTSAPDRAFQNVMVGRSVLFRYPTIIIDELGVNDTLTGANVLAAKIANLSWVNPISGERLNPAADVYYTTLTPFNVNTTDGFTTVANQTVGPRNTEEQAFNTLLRNGSHGVTGYFDVAASLESSVGSGKWYVPAAARGFTDARITVSTSVLDSFTGQANFQPSDAGWGVYIVGTGNAGGTVNTFSMVLSPASSGYVSPSRVNLDKQANKTGTDVQAYVGIAAPDSIHPVRNAYQKVIDDGVIPCSIFKACWVLAGFVPARRRRPAANDNAEAVRRAA